MINSQSDLAYRAFSSNRGMEKEAMLKSLGQGIWNVGKTIGKNPKSFLGGLGRRTADSFDRTVTGTKRFFGALNPKVDNKLYNVNNARLNTHQNVAGGMSGYGRSTSPGNLMQHKQGIRDLFTSNGGVAGPMTADAHAFLQALNPVQRKMVDQALKGGGNAAKREYKLIKNIYSPKARGTDNSQVFNSMYSRYGNVSADRAANAAERYGHNVGGVLGPLAITAPLAFAPYTMAGWAGNAAGASQAPEVALQAGRSTAARTMLDFEKMPMMERMKMMYNPQQYLQGAYEQGNPAALAHHYMYGAGRSESPKNPGMFDYVKHLAMPFFTQNPAEKAMSNGAVRGLQGAGARRINPYGTGGNIPLNYTAKFGMQKSATWMRHIPKALGFFKTPGKALTGASKGLAHLGSEAGAGARMGVNAGIGGTANVMAGDENSNSFNRFIAGAGLGALGGRFGDKYLQKGYGNLYNYKGFGQGMTNIGNAAQANHFGRMTALARRAHGVSPDATIGRNFIDANGRMVRDSAGKAVRATRPATNKVLDTKGRVVSNKYLRNKGTPMPEWQQNAYGAYYKLRKHPVLSAFALGTPAFMYGSYADGKQQVLDAAQQSGEAASQAQMMEMMNNQGFLPRMMAAFNPNMAAGAMQQQDPTAFNEYQMLKAQNMMR